MTTNWDVRTAARNLNIKMVPFETFPDPDKSFLLNARGISNGLSFAVKPGIREAEFVAFHELAHIVLGHSDPRSQGFYTPLELKEVEAHSVALALASDLLTEDADYDPVSETRYITHYATAREAALWIDLNGKRLSKAFDLIKYAGARELVNA